MKIYNLLLAGLLFATTTNLHAQRLRSTKIENLISHSEILNSHFTGFYLFDLGTRKLVAQQLGHQYFTPASNTKLFTLYAGLKLLRDSLPGLHYVEKGDSLIFWATADPVFMHPDFKEQRVLEFLRASNKKLYWAAGRYTGDFYGTGWSYDDYTEYYQPEISEFPVYGNIIRARAEGDDIIFSPVLADNPIFKFITDSLQAEGAFNIRREFLQNRFHQPDKATGKNYEQEIPFKTGKTVTDSLLNYLLPNYAGTVNLKKPLQFKTIYSTPADSVFKRMLLPSDNFIAEQLLLNFGSENSQVLNTQSVIDSVEEKFLTDLPDKPQWVDGSGLSRQNLFTPADMVKLCEKIYNEVNNEDRLFSLLPQGGKTGSLRNYFKAEKPFVFAKTGSLSNNHTLSGYLKTRSGKTLIFSFMNNNYVRPIAEIRKEMERILTMIHERY